MYFSTPKELILSFEYFISRKILKSEVQGKKVSRPIVRISVISIALAVVVNLITIAVVTGFQHEVREKVTGFGSEIFIMGSGDNSIYESDPILKDQAFFEELKKDPQIKSIQYVAYKPILFQSDKIEKTVKLKSGKDTTYIQQEIHGAVLKGVDNHYDFSFFKKYLKKGRLPEFNENQVSEEIMVSDRIARDLNLKINDEVRAFFVKNQPVKRLFKLVGIYHTGLEEFDKKIAIGDIRIVQELNDWGIKAEIEVLDTISANGTLILKARNIGNGNLKFDWGEGFDRYYGHEHCPFKDTTIRLIISDFTSDIYGNPISNSIPDTAYMTIKLKGTASSVCDFKREDGILIRNFMSDDGNKFSLKASEKEAIFTSTPGPGTYNRFVGGFEIDIKDWDQLDAISLRLKKRLTIIPNEHNEMLNVRNIKELQNDIFVWLSFLDLNVAIVLLLMIIIGIINMGSALLVLILVRTNFVGILKALGTNDWSIRKIFLWQSGFLILRGMLIGNVVGLGICFLQKYFGIIKLDPAVYYLNQVPIELSLTSWGLLNAGTLLVCLLALIIPSVVITRIRPIKAIKFN